VFWNTVISALFFCKTNKRTQTRFKTFYFKQILVVLRQIKKKKSHRFVILYTA